MNSDARRARWIAALSGTATALMLLVLAVSAFLRIEHGACSNIAFPAVLDQILRATHRVAASSIGLLLLAISFLVLRCRPFVRGSLSMLALLYGLTLFLAVLGRYSGGNMLPAVVIGNVVAGVALAALFWRMRLMFLLHYSYQQARHAPSVYAAVARSIAALQIWLGGWTAGLLAVSDCKTRVSTGEVAIWPDTTTWKMLDPFTMPGDGPALLTALHWLTMMHALSALILLIAMALLCTELAKSAGRLRKQIFPLLALLGLQAALGMVALLDSHASLSGVMHNVVAALLFAKLVDVHFRLHRA